MKKSSLAQLIPLCVSITLPVSVLADKNLTDLTGGDPFFYTSDQFILKDDKQKALLGIGRPEKTHSQIPHLPVYYGYMNTNSTYRFVNVVEQVFTMIGEGKHGLWRVQEKGTVRQYLKKGANGLPEDADLMAKANQEIIEKNYSAFLPEESWSGYKYPDQRISEQGTLNFIDLPITHPKFDDKYVDHQPIDLPNWYCTMSANDYPYAQKAMNFAFSQSAADQIGPLGKRAGLDIKENYRKVLRLKHLPDARSWVNVGQKGKDKLHVKWEAIDTNKTKAEYYLVERPFFNRPYLFVTAVYDNTDNADHRYVRPAGNYFQALKKQGHEMKNEVTQHPFFHLENGGEARAVGLPIYGVHHPNRDVFGGGGACPLKGGDWGRYPDTSGGSGWPTQYEEVTPLCDSVLVDIKFFTNLDGRDWSDPNKYLANAGVGTEKVTYKMQPGHYGVFTDPYNTERGATNPDRQEVPGELTLTFPTVSPVVSYNEPPAIDMAQGMVPSESTMCRPVMHASLDEVLKK
ncbi:hypothetical protein [Methylophaga sp. OBS4]|uniref:hypothetical protein n=1 Tax=Methylophaga sp. OBS4 TaxID=2991935 RepID=UPI00224D6B56|nr:hypothetical protein [Methylophaga sp. OBS4]MCX4187284.1 hypothetical protein [Methylophaga sp. OBS4]